MDNTNDRAPGEGRRPIPNLLWADTPPDTPPDTPATADASGPPHPAAPSGDQVLPWDAGPDGAPIPPPPLAGPAEPHREQRDADPHGGAGGPRRMHERTQTFKPFALPPAPATQEAPPQTHGPAGVPSNGQAQATSHLHRGPQHAAAPAPASAGPTHGASQALTEDAVLRPRADHPTEGWRGWLYRITGGAVNLGPSRSEVAWQRLVDRCQQPCPGGRRIAVISRKGGVGKTTTTLMVGHTLAAVRPDRVIAIDGNPDAGTLGHRVARQTDATVLDAIGRVGSILGYPDARGFTSQAPSRLEVLASPEDPHASRALRGVDYQAVMDELDKHYNVMLCDTGTGIMDDANLGILDAVDQIVLVTGTALDSARTAGMTLDWLETHGRGQLVREAVVVVNAISDMGRVDIDQVSRHFEQRCRAVHRIPHDRHLEAGAVTDADMLAPRTQEAWLQVSASVVDGFALPSPRAGGERPWTPMGGVR